MICLVFYINMDFLDDLLGDFSKVDFFDDLFGGSLNMDFSDDLFGVFILCFFFVWWRFFF